jgi:colanic acid/amylovoran biosynthesis glycosyltransferase
MRIAFIMEAFPSLSQTFILNQITGILDLGHEVEIFAKMHSQQKKVHLDVEKYDLKRKTHYMPTIPQNKIIRVLNALLLISKNFYKNPLTIVKALNLFKYGKDAISLRNLYYVIPFLKKNYDIIHCHFGPIGVVGVYLKEIGIQGKYITSFHGYDVNSYPQIMGEDVYNDLFAKGDLFTVNTNFTKQQVLKLGCNKGEIAVLPVGLDIEKFEFSPREVKSGEPVKILTIGRLVEKKGHEYALKALAKLVAGQKNIIYFIAGDGPLKNKLESLVTKLGIKNYVKFLGEVEQEEVLDLYQQAHIFLLPSVTARNGDREGQALVLQEAQAVGLPVISTIHNGIPEGVRDGISGFLVPERDVEALVDRLRYLIDHQELWTQMGRTGREFVKKYYDIKKLNKKLITIYQSLIKVP